MWNSLLMMSGLLNVSLCSPGTVSELLYSSSPIREAKDKAV